MGRTFARQPFISGSDTYSDVLSAGATLQTNVGTIEDDLNALRSQAKRILGTTNWYDALGGVGRNLASVDTNLDELESQRLLFRAQVLTDIIVPVSQNFKVLSVASSETPTQTAAVGGGTALGAIVASLSSGSIGSFSIAQVSGSNSVSAKNLVVVRNASTSQVLSSGGKDVFGFLQAEFGIIDGDSFNDVTTGGGKRAQISFVRENSLGNGFESVPVADIESKTINYAYIRRDSLDTLPEDAYLDGVFVDQVASLDVTLDNAIDNQVGAVTQVQNIDVKVDDGVSWDFQDSTGAINLLSIAPAVGGDSLSMKVDTWSVINSKEASFSGSLGVTGTLDINNAGRFRSVLGVDGNFRVGTLGTSKFTSDANTGNISTLGSAVVDSDGVPITIAGTPGQVLVAGAHILSGTNITVSASGSLVLDDLFRRSVHNTLKLSNVESEWNIFRTEFGSTGSILSAIYDSGNKRINKVVTVITSTVHPANNPVNVGVDFTGRDFNKDVDVFFNGQLLRNGSGNDVVQGAGSSEVKFTFLSKNNDVIITLAR